jgi:hypothetical protein
MVVRSFHGGQCTWRHAWHGRRDFYRAHPDDIRHIEIHKAVGASIVSVIACSCGGAAPFLKNRLTNIRLAIVLEIATTKSLRRHPIS